MVADAITLIQLSDCHLPGDRGSRLRGVDTDATLAAVLDQALGSHAASAILATGDLANEGAPEAYRRINALFQNAGVPVLCLPGNHDIADEIGRELVAENIHILGARRFGNWQIVMLDSTVAGWEDGRLGTAELNRIDRLLNQFPDHHALICLHHNPVPVGGAWRNHVALRDAADLFRIAASHRQIRGLLWGHIHQAFEATWNGVRLFGTPSTCFQFCLGSDGPTASNDPPGYRLLRLFPDGSIESEAIFLTPRQNRND